MKRVDKDDFFYFLCFFDSGRGDWRLSTSLPSRGISAADDAIFKEDRAAAKTDTSYCFARMLNCGRCMALRKSATADKDIPKKEFDARNYNILKEGKLV